MPEIIFKEQGVDCAALERMLARKGIEALAFYRMEDYGTGLDGRGVENRLHVVVHLGAPTEPISTAIDRLSAR